MTAERSPDTEAFDWTPFRDHLSAMRAGLRNVRDQENGVWTAEPWGPFNRAEMTRYAMLSRELARGLVVASWLAGAVIFWSCSDEPTVGSSLFAGLFIALVHYLIVKPGLVLIVLSVAAWDTARHKARWFRRAAR
jgi:hypothetical protein